MEVEQQLRSGNSGGRGVAKDIVEATMTNEGKKVKWICKLEFKCFYLLLKVGFYFKSYH